MRKLYYEDSHLTVFSATVTGILVNGTGFWVTLDETAFYPEGGGQPSDRGTLADAKVLDVQEKEDNVWHLVDKPLSVGQQVDGNIDWDRRFDLMQQHTGEHIVSGIANRLYGCHTVGFHMGEDVITIDFDVLLSEEGLREIELLANKAIYENLPVNCSVPSEEELAKIPYRTKKALPYPVRLVEIPGIDNCACCGVHTKTTGEIGMIKLLSCVKFHQGVRIEMVCGMRAYQLMSRVYEQNKRVCQAFSAKMLETGDAAERMNEALTVEKFRNGNLEKLWMEDVAKSYVNCGNVVHFTENLPARPLAEKISLVCGGLAAVFQGNDKQGYTFALISKEKDVSVLGKELTQSLSGKGGGKNGFFQGSVTASREEILTFFRKNGVLS